MVGLNVIYNNLERPDSKNPIDVNASPVDIVKTTYKLWLPIAKTIELRGPTFLHDYDTEVLYQEAKKLLSPYAQSFGNLNNTELEEILNEVNNEKSEKSGLYLSALLNETDIKELDGIFNYKHLGYRLKEGKKLIVRENSIITSLGIYARGNIINFGDINYFGPYIESGVQINFNITNHFAHNVKGGIQINFFKANMMSQTAIGGMQINYDSIKYIMSGNAKGGLQINLGSISEINYNSKNNVSINFGYQGRFPGEFRNTFGGIIAGIPALPFQIYQFFHRKSQPIEVKEKFSDLKELKKLKDRPDEAIEFIKNYDWNDLEETLKILK